MIPRTFALMLVWAALSLGGCASTSEWRTTLHEQLPLLGHRNWIVIADSAYPSQTRAGITTIHTGTDQLTVVKAVLEELGKTRHVKPTILLDAELQTVPESDARRITAYRHDLKALLGDRASQSLPHMEIIKKLDASAELFHVLILKTDLALPYTSVFLELDCGYWDAEAEKRMRSK